MKKLISICMCISILMSMLVFCEIPVSALSSNGKCGKNVTYTFNSSTRQLTISGSGDMYDYDFYESPFYDDTSIKKVDIKYGVTSIGEEAFSGCESLTNITISDSVTSIGEWAFFGCESLTNITIPNSVTSIGKWAFSNCLSLKSIVVDTNNKEYDSRNDCNAIIETVTNTLICGCQNTIIPNSVNNIGYCAFSGCKSLTNITIPDSVTKIDGWAFSDCTSLNRIAIPEVVTSIGEGVFSGCSSLKSMSVDNDNLKYDSRDDCNAIIKTATNTLISGCKNTIIPDSVTSIGDYAFYECYALTKITIPDSVTSIGKSAFSGCESLTNITIPNSVTKIDEYAFSYCTSLNSIAIPKGVTNICDGAFYCCTSLESITIPDSVEYIGEWAFSYCTSLTNITIADSVEYIGELAFYWCDALTNITIPDSVEYIGERAFAGCISLASVYYSGTKAQWEYILIDYENDDLLNANIHYNSCKKHTYVTKNAKKATYFAKGYTGDKYCTVCKSVITKGKSIPKLTLKKPSIALTAGSKKIYIKHNKVSGAKYYEINIKIGKKWYKYNTTKTTYIKTKLKKGTRYYVKVRAVTTNGKSKAYSSFSTTKSIKAK